MSEHEERLFNQIKLVKLPIPAREYRFHPTRLWRFDFAWLDLKLAVEVEGVVWQGKGGRHQRADGLTKDCQKYGAAMELGWDVYRCTQTMVDSGEALNTIEVLINLRGAE